MASKGNEGKSSISGGLIQKPPISAKNACLVVQSLYPASWKSYSVKFGIKPKSKVSLTFTERRADDHWPRASINKNSDPSSAIQARSNLYLHFLNVPSDLAGRFGDTDVQQQRMMVRMQVDKMFHVPLPSGSGTHSRVRVLFMIKQAYKKINTV